MEEEKIKKEDPGPYLIPGSIIVAGVLVAGAVIYTYSPQNLLPKNPAAAISGSIENTVVANLSDDDPVLGNPDALVSVVEFSDFQCPFCRRLYKQTLPAIKEHYIKTGKVKFVYRDFPLISIHNMAQKYAEGSECADEQGKFWFMHDKIFDEQEKLGAGSVFDYTVADVKKWAREIGLDGAQFDGCLDSGKYEKEVEKDLADGQLAGVTGTPGTFINGRLVQGAVPFAQFQTLIEEELKKVNK